VFATDSTGVKVWEASYLPFGGVHTSTGVNINLRFPGQWFQSESGLHQNWMRDYDPTTGRYMQADPLGLVDGASVFGYARQNPGRYVDPTGEFIPIPIAIGIAVGAGVGYYETGCWQGALVGGIAGGVAGIVGNAFTAANTIPAGTGIGAGASALSQIINNELAGFCGCKNQKRSFPDLVTDPNFHFNNAMGAFGGMNAAVVAASTSPLTAWAGSSAWRNIIRDLIAEGVGFGTSNLDITGAVFAEIFGRLQFQ
jgi:RHS repeat-associated protein